MGDLNNSMNDTQDFQIPEGMTIEQTVEMMSDILHGFCNSLAEQGIDEMLIMSAVLTVYAERAADFGDREIYEEQLEAALEEPWDEHTVH